MLKNLIKTINISATSMIDEKAIAHMNASISGSGSLNINQSIVDPTAYLENQSECDADYEQFKKYVLETTGGE